MNFKDHKNFTPGKLITVTYANGRQLSGVLVGVTDKEIKISYYNEALDAMQTVVVTAKEKTMGEVEKFTTLTHIKFKNSEKAKTSSATQEITEDVVIKAVQEKSIEELIELFKNASEDVLATLAIYLPEGRKYEFLYKVSSIIGVDVQEKVVEFKTSEEKRSESKMKIWNKLNGEKSTEKKTENKEQKVFENPFEELFKGAFGSSDSKGMQGIPGLQDIIGKTIADVISGKTPGGVGALGGLFGENDMKKVEEMIKELKKKFDEDQNKNDNSKF